jgi:peptide/nickel transport system substrate-binding protein
MPEDTTRRSFLAAAGTGAAAALAGCSSNDPAEGTPAEETDTAEPDTEAEASTDTPSPTPSDEIGEFPQDHIKVDTEESTVGLVIEDVDPSEFGEAIEAAGYSFGSVESTQAPFDPLMPRADRQWDRYGENRGPSSEEQAARDEVYYFVEETNWEAVQELPLVHSLTQRLWQNRVDVRMSGTMEDQTFDDLELEGDQTLQLASPGPVQTLDPVNAKGSGAGYNQYNGTLLNFEDGDLPPVSDLATDYSVSEDGLTYTFDLKEGIQFHDGQELTAQDFVYSWERAAGAEETRNADDIVGSTFTIEHETTDGLDGTAAFEPGTLAVEAVDDYTLEFTLESAFTGTLSQLAAGTFAPIPEGSVAYPTDYEQHGLDGLLYEGEYGYNEFFSTDGDGPFFAGVGPFEVDSWSKGDQIRLSAFDDYHGNGPQIEAITYTVIGNASTRFQRFKNGNLDIVNQIPVAEFNPDRRNVESDEGTYSVGTYELSNGETVNYGQAPALDTDYIVFNCARVPKPARKAMALLINQDRISNDVYKGLNPSAYHLTPPGAFMGENPGESYDAHYQDGENNQLDRFSDGYPYGVGEARIEEARSVMEEAGYTSDEPLEVEFTVFSGDPAFDSISKTLRDKAQAANINISIVKADFGTIIGQALDGSMDMFSLGDGMEWPESDNFLRFIPPYDEPSGMFTRWTYQLQASDADLSGDDAETVRQNVYDELVDN